MNSLYCWNTIYPIKEMCWSMIISETRNLLQPFIYKFKWNISFYIRNHFCECRRFYFETPRCSGIFLKIGKTILHISEMNSVIVCTKLTIFKLAVNFVGNWFTHHSLLLNIVSLKFFSHWIWGWHYQVTDKSDLINSW